MEATLVAASADGVGPAVLLSVPKSNSKARPAQYLINAPEGFARLVLEHKARPTAGLCALFALDTTPEALGGLGGLLLRLRQEGHASLTVVGPQGTEGTVDSLSHIIRLPFPQLSVHELSQGRGCAAAGRGDGQQQPDQADTCYADEQVLVAPLWMSGIGWQPPSWLTAPQAGALHNSNGAAAPNRLAPGGVTPIATSSASSSSEDDESSDGDAGLQGFHRVSTSEEDDSDSDTSGADEPAGARGDLSKAATEQPEIPVADQQVENSPRDAQHRASGNSSANESSTESETTSSSSGSSDSSGSSSDADDKDKVQLRAAASGGIRGARRPGPGERELPQDRFSELDQLLASRAAAAGSRQPPGSHSRQPLGPGRGRGRGLGGAHRHSQHRGPAQQGARELARLRHDILSTLRASSADPGAQQPAASANGAVKQASQAEEHDMAPAKRQKTTAVTDNQASQKQQQPRLVKQPPVQQRKHMASVPQQHGGQPASRRGRVLGYLLLCRTTGDVVLVISVPHIMLLPLVNRHAALKQLSSRAAPRAPRMVLHLTPPEVTRAAEYRSWARSLPGTQVIVGSGSPARGPPSPSKSHPAPDADGQVQGGTHPEPQQQHPASSADGMNTAPSQPSDTPNGNTASRGQADQPTAAHVLQDQQQQSGHLPLGFHSAARMTFKLHMVSPLVFPLPYLLEGRNGKHLGGAAEAAGGEAGTPLQTRIGQAEGQAKSAGPQGSLPDSVTPSDATQLPLPAVTAPAGSTVQLQAPTPGAVPTSAGQQPQPVPVQGKIHHGSLLQRILLSNPCDAGKNQPHGRKPSAQPLVIDVFRDPHDLSPHAVQQAVLEEQGDVLRIMLQDFKARVPELQQAGGIAANMLGSAEAQSGRQSRHQSPTAPHSNGGLPVQNVRCIKPPPKPSAAHSPPVLPNASPIQGVSGTPLPALSPGNRTGRVMRPQYGSGASGPPLQLVWAGPPLPPAPHPPPYPQPPVGPPPPGAPSPLHLAPAGLPPPHVPAPPLGPAPPHVQPHLPPHLQPAGPHLHIPNGAAWHVQQPPPPVLPVHPHSPAHPHPALLHHQPRPPPLPSPTLRNSTPQCHAAAAYQYQSGADHVNGEQQQPEPKRQRLAIPDSPASQLPTTSSASRSTNNRRAASALRQALGAKGAPAVTPETAPATAQAVRQETSASAPEGQQAAAEVLTQAGLPAAHGASVSLVAAEDTGAANGGSTAAEQGVVGNPGAVPSLPSHAAAAGKVIQPASEGAGRAEASIVAMPQGSMSEETCPPACLLTPDAAQTAVLFLGTGCAEPSKYRGPSAILLKLPGTAGSMLLDCGEGTWGQLLRWLGPERAAAQVASLRCIWISHKHADHCLGLPQLLAARPPSAPPLLVAGPREVGRWVQHLVHLHGFKATFVHNREFSGVADPSVAPPRQPGPVHSALGCGSLDLTSWRAVPVNHCFDAFGLVVTHASGWKLVYSGDTRPCKALIDAGKGATLLIHEATFEPDLQCKACDKKHCTSAEALEVSDKMGAYRTVLTHFSQRYPRMPAGLGIEPLKPNATQPDEPNTDELDQNDTQATHTAEGQKALTDQPSQPAATTTSISASKPVWLKSVVAFDGMLIPFSCLPALPTIGPIVAQVLYKEESA